VGGGVWTLPLQSTFPADAPRLYEVTGYRDYMFLYLRTLLSVLANDGYPMDRLFLREDGAGHDLYAWHYSEMWSWMDKGERPAAGAVAAGWTRETVPGAGTLLSLARRADGAVVASGTAGSFFVRDASGAWTSAPAVGTANWAGLCLLPSGAGIAVGEGKVATTSDGGGSWKAGKAVPEYFGQSFGSSYLNSVACTGASRIVGGGYWTGVQSDDGGATWRGYSMAASWGGQAQIASVRVGPSGTALAAGYYDYLARSVAGAAFAEVSKDDGADWLNGLAAASGGSWWAVGEAGVILHSADDGATFQSQRVTGGEDLYAVSFFDESVGVAVGLHGYAVTTRDGGATWTPAPTGLDAFLSDVVLLDAHTALAVGEGGALTLSF
jgi:hypothetical protein